LYLKFASNDNRKLRTYRKFEFLCDAENHLIRNIPGKFRTAISKFRCGVALVRIEAGKYENVWVVNTVYFNYKVIEDEHHVLSNSHIINILISLLKFVLKTLSVLQKLFIPILLNFAFTSNCIVIFFYSDITRYKPWMIYVMFSTYHNWY
jgi:hypothetical protein